MQVQMSELLRLPTPACGWLVMLLCGAVLQSGCAKKSTPEVLPDAAAALPDHTAGKTCKSDADCVIGHCATVLHIQSSSTEQPVSGGYCTTDCENDSHCGSGGKCSVPAGEESGECLATCSDDAGCREDYSCVGAGLAATIHVSGTCQPKPKTDQLDDGVVGQTCSSDAACGGGECDRTSPLGLPFPGSYCSGRCFDDSQCGSGGGCLVFENSGDAGHCFARCESDDDCTRDGYRCRELSPDFDACYPAPAALADYTAGSACASDLDCGGGKDTCATRLPYASLLGDGGDVTAPGGYCTQPCSLDAECGAGAQCISHGLEGGMCLATCTTNDDCRTGYTCIVHGRDHSSTDSVCIPAP
jgi:hypothetical protein